MTGLLIGDFERPEFSAARETLYSRLDVRAAEDVAAALAQLAEDRGLPELIVTAQAWPGQFDVAAILQLRHAAPLARILAVLGTWCEGELRSGSPPPGVVRTYWHKWHPWWSNEFQGAAARQLRWWNLPETATDEERLIQSFEEPWVRESGLVAVVSRARDQADMLCHACRNHGYASAWVDLRRPVQFSGPSAVIWDGSAERFDELSTTVRQFPGCPVLALLSFPRLDDVTRVIERGATAVISSPFRLDELFHQLREAIAGRQEELSPASQVA